MVVHRFTRLNKSSKHICTTLLTLLEFAVSLHSNLPARDPTPLSVIVRVSRAMFLVRWLRENTEWTKSTRVSCICRLTFLVYCPQLSDVKRVSDSKGKVSVTSSNMSFVLDSTPETRNLSESIRVAAQKRGPAVYSGPGGMNSGDACNGIGRGESGDINYENNQRAPGSSSGGHGRKGLSHSKSASSFSSSLSRFAHVSRKGGAFQPSNTLGLPSRKPGGVSGSARGKALAGLAASSPGQRASLNARGGSLGGAARSFGHGGWGTDCRIASSMRSVQGHRGSGTITRRSLVGANDRTNESGDTSRSMAGRGGTHGRGTDGGGEISGDNDDEVRAKKVCGETKAVEIEHQEWDSTKVFSNRRTT